MKELAEEVLQRLMAYDIDGRVGADRYERCGFESKPDTHSEMKPDSVTI